ncbi:MAG: hypothetical protein U0M15_08390 [Bacillota bacterium]|nr:hypothetical protein [Bacillota bacterium]
MKNNDKQIILTFIESFENLKVLMKRCKEEQSENDTILSEYYHLFECGKFPAHIRSKILKEMELFLHERRDNKDILYTLNSIHQKLMQNGMNAKISKNLNSGKKAFKVHYLGNLFEEYSQYLVYDYTIKQRNASSKKE